MEDIDSIVWNKVRDNVNDIVWDNVLYVALDSVRGNSMDEINTIRGGVKRNVMRIGSTVKDFAQREL